MLLYNHTLPMDAHRSILSWERSWKINFKFIKTSAFAFVLVPPHGHISPSDFMKTIWLTVEHRVELHTSTTVLKYWKGISSFYLNDMFMPSLNNCNTRSQKKDKKVYYKKWNMLSSDKNLAATTASFTHSFSKKILQKVQ